MEDLAWYKVICLVFDDKSYSFNTGTRRKQCYKKYLKQGASDKEVELLQNAWASNQLTGDDRFIEEIELRTGRRIEHRSRGRPAKEKRKK